MNNMTSDLNKKIKSLFSFKNIDYNNLETEVCSLEFSRAIQEKYNEDFDNGKRKCISENISEAVLIDQFLSKIFCGEGDLVDIGVDLMKLYTQSPLMSNIKIQDRIKELSKSADINYKNKERI